MIVRELLLPAPIETSSSSAEPIRGLVRGTVNASFLGFFTHGIRTYAHHQPRHVFISTGLIARSLHVT